MDNQNSSHTVWYIIGIVVIALALWYFLSQSPSSTITTETPITEETPQTTLSTGDSTADISADLNQTVDSSAALSADADASAQAVSGF